MSHNPLHIANKIIAATDIEHGELISNLKLQKLLYYVQGYNIAVFGKPLFENDIQAWQYGPVVPEVYDAFKKFGPNSIMLEDGCKVAELSKDEEELFSEVLQKYGEFSAIGLMNRTHNESPWKSVFPSDPQGVISKALIGNYFKSQLIG